MAAPKKDKLSDVLARLRRACLALPDTVETSSWGHPNWRVGKRLFASWDEYEGRPCIAFLAGFPLQDVLLQDPRFFYAPYAGKRGWVCLKTDGRLDWREIGELLARSHALSSAARPRRKG